MTIKTINKPIRHQQNPQFDAQRLAALEEALEELTPTPDEYAEDVADTLRKFNPQVREIIVLNNCAIIEIGEIIREVTIAPKIDYADLFTSLLAEVLRASM